MVFVQKQQHSFSATNLLQNVKKKNSDQQSWLVFCWNNKDYNKLFFVTALDKTTPM